MLKAIFPFVLLLAFSNCGSNSESQDHSKLESLLKQYYSPEKLKGVNSIFIVGDNGCQMCYTNLEFALKEKNDSLLLYYSSNSRIKYNKTIFKKYLPESRLKIIYQPDILNHISENFGFIKSFVELEIVDDKVSNVILHN